MSTTTQIKLCARMTFPGGADRERMEKVSNFHNAVAILLFQEQLGKEAAVAIRRWYLQNNVLHPEDSAPMGMLHNGDEAWSDFNDVTGGQGDTIDQLARAEWAAQRVCRALAEACKTSEIPLIDCIQACIPDTWDDKDGIEYLLELATWRPAKEAAAHG
jgi:hypothetical protein